MASITNTELNMSYTYDENILGDLYKKTYSCRPDTMFWNKWKNSTEDEKQDIWDNLCDSHEVEMKMEEERTDAAIAKFNKEIQTLINAGAGDEETAIRWWVDSLELDDYDRAYGVDYVCYLAGLPYNMADKISPALAA